MAISLPIVSKFDDKGTTAAERALKGVAVVSAAAFTAAITGAVAFGVEAIKAAAEAEAVTRGLENAAKNAGVFGDSARAISKATDALDDHSRKLGEMTGIDDEIINQIKTGWLAVPDLAARGTDGINKLAEVVADVAAGTGKDVQAIGLAFQRVAGDSETAFSKLTRAGIVFTDEQKATYQSILDTSGEIEAQSYLIEQLGDKYEGAAQAAANPFEQLRVIFGNLQEDIGAKLLPALDPVIPLFQELSNSLVTSPEFNAFLDEMATELTDMVPSLGTILQHFITLVTDTLPQLTPAVQILGDALNIVGVTLGLINDESPETISNLEIIGELVGAVSDGFTFIDEWANKSQAALSAWGPAIRAVIDSVKMAFNPLESVLRNIYALIQYILGNEAAALNALGMGKTEKRGGPNRLSYPGTAKGGVTAMGGLQWVGEKGPELVSLPQGATVTPIPQHMRADNLAGSMRGGGGQVVYNIQVSGGMGVDGAQLGEQIVTAIRKYERTSGAVFARA